MWFMIDAAICAGSVRLLHGDPGLSIHNYWIPPHRQAGLSRRGVTQICYLCATFQQHNLPIHRMLLETGSSRGRLKLQEERVRFFHVEGTHFLYPPPQHNPFPAVGSSRCAQKAAGHNDFSGLSGRRICAVSDRRRRGL